MKTVEEVRRERLAMLRKEAGSLVALNEKLGLSARDATLSQIVNGAKNSRTGTPKQMGSKMARELEAACGKEVGWMDTDPALKGESAEPDVSRLVADIASLKGFQREWMMIAATEAVTVARQLPETKGTKSKNVPAQAESPKRKRQA